MITASVKKVKTDKKKVIFSNEELSFGKENNLENKLEKKIQKTNVKNKFKKKADNPKLKKSINELDPENLGHQKLSEGQLNIQYFVILIVYICSRKQSSRFFKSNEFEKLVDS